MLKFKNLNDLTIDLEGNAVSKISLSLIHI